MLDRLRQLFTSKQKNVSQGAFLKVGTNLASATVLLRRCERRADGDIIHAYSVGLCGVAGTEHALADFEAKESDRVTKMLGEEDEEAQLARAQTEGGLRLGEVLGEDSTGDHRALRLLHELVDLLEGVNADRAAGLQRVLELFRGPEDMPVQPDDEEEQGGYKEEIREWVRSRRLKRSS